MFLTRCESKSAKFACVCSQNVLGIVRIQTLTRTQTYAYLNVECVLFVLFDTTHTDAHMLQRKTSSNAENIQRYVHVQQHTMDFGAISLAKLVETGSIEMQMFDFTLLYIIHFFFGEVLLFIHEHMRMILYGLIGIAAQSMCVNHIQTRKRNGRRKVTYKIRDRHSTNANDSRQNQSYSKVIRWLWNEIAWFSSQTIKTTTTAPKKSILAKLHANL